VAAPSYLDLWRTGGQQPYGRRSGDLPAPLDALDGSLLVGESGSHPLAFLTPEMLVRPTTDGLTGGFEVEGRGRVGEGVAARLHIKATRSIEGRSARLSLRGFLLREVERSATRGSGKRTRTERWVEVVAEELETITLAEPALPLALAEGETLDLPISAPAPRLGPPSAHLGAAAVLWLLEAAWDIPMRGDERAATLVTVEQHPDLVRSGALNLGPSALFDEYSTGEATFALEPAPPLLVGSTFTVRVAHPKAEGGRGARVEIHADLDGYGSVCLDSVEAPTAALAAGLEARLTIPADAPPVLDAKGISLRYRIRALVDRPLLPDLAVERGVAIVSADAAEG
jgi:hypothetical protein